MRVQLSPAEVRVLGTLIEKDLTTPDAYPLSVNALTTGCNQRSNRDPVTNLTEAEVMAALDGLTDKAMAWERGGAGGRVPRFAHKLAGTLSKTYDFSRRELGVLAVLLLRGPQTPGELRARAPRTSGLQSLEEVEATLAGLAQREDGPFVAELAREPGRREARFAHLFAPLPAPRAPEEDQAAPSEPGLPERLAVLEQRIADLEAQVAALRRGEA